MSLNSQWKWALDWPVAALPAVGKILKDEKMAGISAGDFARGKAEIFLKRGSNYMHSQMIGEPLKVQRFNSPYPSQHLTDHLKLCQTRGNIPCFKNYWQPCKISGAHHKAFCLFLHFSSLHLKNKKSSTLCTVVDIFFYFIFCCCCCPWGF